MKVKVVLAAAMWQNPHILILDEPTNYLDREGLGALVLAIKDYKGGVLIISHNKEICDGGAEEEISGNKVQEDIVDASGNKIDMNAVDNTNDKEKKKKLKELEKKLKDGVKKKTLTDEEKWALEDQILELKEKLGVKKKTLTDEEKW